MNTEATRRYSLLSRFTGLLSDAVLFALFLAMGVGMLNILIQTIVLVVGIAQGTGARPILTEGLEGFETLTEAAPSRLGADAMDLGIAILGAIVATAAHFGFLRLRRRYMHLFGASGFQLFVSKRYLLSREGSRLVSLISIVSVLGVAVGVMALIVVISVMEGFDQTLVKKFMGVFSHIQIKPDPRYFKDKQIPEDIWGPMIEHVAAKDFVKGVSPILDHQTIIQKDLGSRENFAFAFFRGIDPKTESNVTDFMNYVTLGESVPGDREVVVGERLAINLGLRQGDTIFAIGKIVPTANRVVPKTMKLTVVGVFHSGLYDVDDKFIYTNLATIQEMLVQEGTISALHVRVDDPQKVNEYGEQLLDVIPRGYGILTWQMLNPQFFEALWMEKVAMFIILLLIVLVAALNIIGTLVMTVVQKTRDIGILKSMGATSGSIMLIFLYHGFLIGLVGTSLGVVWGLRLCRFVAKDIQKIFEMPGGVYGIDRLPVVVEPWLIVFMAVCALSICIVASLIPAYQASRLNPVEALRYD